MLIGKILTAAVIALIISGMAILVVSLSVTSYTITMGGVGKKDVRFSPGEIVEDKSELECGSYYKDCICYGFLTTLFSDARRYTCIGFNFCSEIRTLECR